MPIQIRSGGGNILGFADVFRQMVDIIMLGNTVAQGFEHARSAVRAAVVYDEQAVERSGTNEFLEFVDLKPLGLVVSGNNDDSWRHHTIATAIPRASIL
jgi:hypothetical protein